jgi:hypothetical protein
MGASQKPPFLFYLPFVLAGQAFLFSLMRKESKRIKKNLGHAPATADPMRWFFAQRALSNKLQENKLRLSGTDFGYIMRNC